MTDSSPADLAVAYRSFPRRLRDALTGAGGDADREAAARALVPSLDAAVARGAGALGVSAGDLATTGAAVADKIAAIAADQWDEGVLAALRSAAVEAGGALRAIENAAHG
jgi:hypothetical protein